LWDSAELEKENIPTIIELIDHPDVIEALAQETASHWQDKDDQQFAQEEAQQARDDLRKAIDDSRAIIASGRHASIMDLRNKLRAHSLSKTRREKKVPLHPMKYGDDRQMLDASLPIVEALYCWVNGNSLSFEDSRKIDRENARALWEACRFTITN